MKKILITGASGFIGYHTVLECVERGCFVYAVVHKACNPELVNLQNNNKLQIIRSDVTDLNSLKQEFKKLPKLDAVIHCAGRASDVGWDKEFKKVNFESIVILVQLVKEFEVERFVFVSTTDVYGLKDFNGENEDELGYDENAKNSYPKYKIKAEKFIKSNLQKERYNIVRPAAVWGDDDPTLTKRIKDFFKMSPFIIHFGKWRGANRWPLVHVKSVAIANYIAALNKDITGKAFNVIDKNRTTIDEFYRIVAKTYFPKREYKTVTLPFWVGIIIGGIVTFISNILNLKKPFIDPSLYALYSVSTNLDFNGDFFIEQCLKLEANSKDI